MKIAIDCSKAVNEKAGVARYTWELASNMPRIYKNDEFFYFFNFMRGGKEKKKLIEKLMFGNNNISTKIYRLPGNLKEKIFPSKFSLLNFWLQGCDIYHATEFLSFDLGLKIPQVLTVHDLTMIKFPSHLGKKISSFQEKIVKLACGHSAKIITDSDATKKDIIKYFSIPAEKIKVVYLGYDQKRFKPINYPKEIQKKLLKYKITFPYIVFVGTIEPRKNIANLILAFNEFCKTELGKKYHLVLVGRRGWNTEEIDQAYNNSKVKDKIHFLDFVVDEDLVYFYNGAALFCYPSFYEGFGLPPLEAMACGIPVITSNVSSLPEVTRDAGIFIDPNNITELAEAIKCVLSNDKTRNKMKQKSLVQAAKFSWDKSVHQTHKIYEEVLTHYDKQK